MREHDVDCVPLPSVVTILPKTMGSGAWRTDALKAWSLVPRRVTVLKYDTHVCPDVSSFRAVEVSGWHFHVSCSGEGYVALD
jgi:hypothetical protein